MYSETYPLTVNAEHQWMNFDHLDYENRRKNNLTFLYIGKYNESLQYFSSFFKSGIFADGYHNACLSIEQLLLAKDTVPDTIIIDIPLNRNALENFYIYLRGKNLLSRISLIYNEKQLDKDRISLLRKSELVDEITDVSSWDTNFSRKVAFLKKVKGNAGNLHLTQKILPNYEGAMNKKVPVMKRLFDISVASVAILICSPVIVLTAIAIRLESKGPVFYTSSRAGRGFKIFRFYKFRTMETDADKKIESLAHLNQYGQSENGVRFLKLCNDPRVTRVGKFLRKTSLDEIPQLLNVIKGDMSLVGNRPLPIYEATTMTTNEFVERFMAPAGITGLWQVKKKGNPNMTAEERIGLDISYARKYSLAYDMWIIAQTPAALFQKSNA